MLYAIIALVALAALSGWLAWLCLRQRTRLARALSENARLRQDRAIRQNLQRLLDRREAEIRRLKSQASRLEGDYHELESRANDLNVELFRESGLRILAEKEDGANRLKLGQLERQVEDARRKLRAQQAEAADAVHGLQQVVAAQEKEIARLRQANARRMKKPADPLLANQVTLDDLLPPPQ